MAAILRKETKTNLYLSRDEDETFIVTDSLRMIFGEGQTEREAVIDYWRSLSEYAALKMKEVRHGEWFSGGELIKED